MRCFMPCGDSKNEHFVLIYFYGQNDENFLDFDLHLNKARSGNYTGYTRNLLEKILIGFFFNSFISINL